MDREDFFTYYTQRQLKELEIERFKRSTLTAVNRVSNACLVNGSPGPFEAEHLNEFPVIKPTRRVIPFSSSNASDVLIKSQPSADKYEVFLELKDDFGEFKGYDESAASFECTKLNGHPPTENERAPITNLQVMWEQLLSCIDHILEQTFHVLIVSHTGKHVFNAFSTPLGISFYMDLCEVMLVCERVECCYSYTCIKIDAIERHLEHIHSKWNILRRLFDKFNQKCHSVIGQKCEELKMTLSSGQGDRCHICFFVSSSHLQGNCTLYQFAGLHYHLSCANLWLNRVQDTLPQVRQLPASLERK